MTSLGDSNFESKALRHQPKSTPKVDFGAGWDIAHDGTMDLTDGLWGVSELCAWVADADPCRAGSVGLRAQSARRGAVGSRSAMHLELRLLC